MPSEQITYDIDEIVTDDETTHELLVATAQYLKSVDRRTHEIEMTLCFVICFLALWAMLKWYFGGS